MKLHKALATLAATALLITGCGSNNSAESETTSSPTAQASTAASFPTTVKHSSGETTIEKKPEKIVVFDTAALDTIDAIGAGDRVVGTVTNRVPTWLKDSDGIDYSKVESVGEIKEPDVEAIAKLNPDLVIVGNRTQKTYPELSKRFTTIDASVSWKEDGYSERVPENIKMLGQALGETEAADKAADKVTETIKKYKDTAKDQGKALVVMTNAGEISLHGDNSRFAPLFDVFGFTPAHEQKADEGHKGEKVSFETIKQIDPDWIFVLDRDAAVGKSDDPEAGLKVLDNDLVNSTKAGQNKRIVNLTPERWYLVMTGADNFVVQLDEVAEAVKAKG